MSLGQNGQVVLGKVAFTDAGEYNATGTFNLLDYVTTEDSCYLSLKDGNKGNAVTDKAWWKCLANGKPATEATKKALEAITAAQTATTNANAAAVRATNAAGILDDAKKALEDLENQLEYLKTLGDKGVDMLNVMDALRMAIVTDMQLVPSRMEVTYPKQIRTGNPVVQKIIAKMFPSYLVQNVIFQQRNGGNSIEVNPDGTIDVLSLGKSKVHVIPPNNTGIYQTIEIEVVNPQPRKTSSGKLRLTTSGKLRIS